MQNDKYDWERFWSVRGSSVNLDFRGFLADPHSHPVYNPNLDIVSTPYLSNSVKRQDDVAPPLLVLLGEPGIGKTTEFTRLYEQEKELVDATRHFTLKRNLGSIPDASTLRAKVFESPIFQKWFDSDSQLFLYLDSLDEGLLNINVLAALLLDELKELPLERLALRITCRSAGWPTSFEKQMRELWHPEVDLAVIYELAPLRKVDVEIAARTNSIDETKFIKEVVDKEVTSFATSPITLQFLLTIYKERGTLPDTRTQIYEEGCRRLCQEMNEDRRTASQTGDISENQRLIVAGRIAAIMTLANRNTVYTGTDATTSEDISVADLRGEKETADGNAFEVSGEVIAEVLDTGLFNLKGPDRLGWAHQTYREFLAAWYLAGHNMETPQVLSLVTHPVREEVKLVPQLHETAAWLASLNDDVFEAVVKTDPDVLLRSDVATSDEAQKVKLVEVLLRMYDEGELVDTNWGDINHYKKLAHSRIAEQLEPFVKSKSKNAVARQVAIRMAVECKASDLEDALVSVALDGDEHPYIRREAAYAIGQFAHADTKRKLRPLALDHIEDDPDDEIKGAALQAVWPAHMNTDELLSVLTAQRPNEQGISVGGAYGIFLNSRFEEDIPREELHKAMRWLLDDFGHHGPASRLDDVRFEDVIGRIVYQAWETFDEPEVKPLFAQWVSLCLKHFTNIVASTGSDEHSKQFANDLKTGQAKRRELLKVVIHQFSRSNDGEVWHLLLYSEPPILFEEDVSWLCTYLTTDLSSKERKIVARTISKLFWQPRTERDLILETAQANPSLADALGTHAVTISSPEADEMRQEYEKRKRREEKIKQRRATPEPLEEPPEARIVDLLSELEQGNTDVWWRICHLLNFDEYGRRQPLGLHADLTRLIGWEEAQEDTKTRLVDAAWHYLRDGSPKNEEWLGTNIFYFPALAGFRALFYFAKHDRRRLDSLSSNIWEKWTAIIVTHPAHNEEEREIHEHLLRLAYKHAPDEIVAALRVAVEEISKRGEIGNSFHKLEHIVDDYFVQKMLLVLESSELTAALRTQLLSLIMVRGHPSAVAYAEQLWRNYDFDNADERNVALNAAVDLLNVDARRFWSIISPIFLDDSDAARELAFRLSHAYKVSSIINELTEAQKADLYVWIERFYPHDEDPVKKSGLVTKRESIGRFRDSVLRSLQDHGTYEACRQVRKLLDLFPDSWELKWALSRAKSMARRMTWEPLTPANILKVTRGSRKRLVRSEAELTKVVIESLGRMEEKLHGEVPAVQFLWDGTRPKSENDFSDWVKLHLDDDLNRRGVVANREVQIHRSKDRTDLHVNAVVPGPDTDSYDVIRVIIEVKGSWHRDLKTAMQDQLINQYLQDNQCTSGIYLVGWFNCDKWDDSDYKKHDAPKCSLEEARAYFDEQAQALSGSELQVAAYVVDTALRY